MSNAAGALSAHDEFDILIAKLSESRTSTEQEDVRQSIWDRYGVTGTTFITDMANFSVTSRTLGICHFLKLIHRARAIIRPIIKKNDGILLKCEADNCYAFFAHPNDALRASFEVNSELFRMNQERDPADRIYISVGIDYGRFLLIGEEDFYGDPVNTASKLGEDLAGKSETLITDRALEKTDYQVHENAERMVARVSDIEISYLKLKMAQSNTR